MGGIAQRVRHHATVTAFFATALNGFARGRRDVEKTCEREWNADSSRGENTAADRGPFPNDKP